MKAVKIIVFVLLGLVALFLIVTAFLPKTSYFESSIVINAKPKVIFDHVNNLKMMGTWSPWEDSTQVITYEGLAEGVGAIERWEGEMVGKGKQEIIESTPFEMVKSSLDFHEKGTGESFFKLEETPEGVKVIWGFEALNLKWPLGRFFGLMIPKQMKEPMEKGLQNLKEKAEAYVEPDWKTGEITEATTEKIYALTVMDSCKVENIDSKLEELYEMLMEYAGKTKANMAGAPFALYYTWDMEKMIQLEAGIPLAKTGKGEGRIKAVEFPATKVVKVLHAGGYETIEHAHYAIGAYLKERELMPNGPVWEVYLTDPKQEPDQCKWETEILYPVK